MHASVFIRQNRQNIANTGPTLSHFPLQCRPVPADGSRTTPHQSSHHGPHHQQQQQQQAVSLNNWSIEGIIRHEGSPELPETDTMLSARRMEAGNAWPVSFFHPHIFIGFFEYFPRLTLRKVVAAGIHVICSQI